MVGLCGDFEMGQKLNWNKAEYRRAGKAYGTGIVAGTTTTWRSPGKYQWQHVRKIPTDYLFWVAQKWRPGRSRDMADKELLRRFDGK